MLEFRFQCWIGFVVSSNLFSYISDLDSVMFEKMKIFRFWIFLFMVLISVGVRSGNYRSVCIVL